MAESKALGYLKFVNGSLKNKTYSFAIFTAVVVFVLLIGAIRPTLTTMYKINTEIKQKKLINSQLEAKIKNLSDLRTQYATMKDDVDALPLIFPTQGNFSLFMSNVDQIAKNNGFYLAGINYSSAGDSTIPTSVLVPWSARITVTGSRSNIYKLMQDYESMPMYPIVRQMSFANVTNSKGQTDFTIELIIYRIDDDKFYD